MLLSFRTSIGSASFHTGIVAPAARRGTRIKRDAIKRAQKRAALIALENKPPEPPKISPAMLKKLPQRIDETVLRDPPDDIFSIMLYKRQFYSFAQSVEMHRQHHHPTILNMPDADLFAFVELSMSTSKKTQFVGNFSDIVLYTYPFPVNHERQILALNSNEDSIELSLKAGATMAYGPECIKMAKSGKINFKEYDFIVAHSQLLPELINARNLLKAKFPKPTDGTAGINVPALVERFSKGYEYKVQKHPVELDFGWINAKLGKLDSPIEELEANLKVLLINIEKRKPQSKPSNLIAKVWLKCTTKEMFKVPHDIYFKEEKEKEKVMAEEPLEETVESV